MSLPPPGLGGGGTRTGPPPGFGSSASGGVPPAGAGGIASSTGGGGGAGNAAGPGGGGGGGGGRNNEGQAGAAVIVRTQIVFLLSGLTEETFDKGANELRTLVSSHGPEMYHHFLRRAAIVANPVISILAQHSQQYRDDPAAPPPNVPTTGGPALAWRLLMTEAIRAARDVTLAPHFVMVMFTPFQATPLPLPSLALLALTPPLLFALSAFTLAFPNILPPSNPYHGRIVSALHQTFPAVMNDLQEPDFPFWSTQAVPTHPVTQDITLQEARSLLLALYPHSPTPEAANSRAPTPTNPTQPHASPLNTYERTTLLSALTMKFSSPAIVLQTLSASSPGGPPSSREAIPLAEVLFELGTLTRDPATVEVIARRWWSGYLSSSAQYTAEAIRTIDILSDGLREGRIINPEGVVLGLISLEEIDFHQVVKSYDSPLSMKHHGSAADLLSKLISLPPQQPIPPIAGLLPPTMDAPIPSNLLSIFTCIDFLLSFRPDQIAIFEQNPPPLLSACTRVVEPPQDDSWPRAVQQQAWELQGGGLYNCMGLFRVIIAGIAMADVDYADENVVTIGRAGSTLLHRVIEFAPDFAIIAIEKIIAYDPSTNPPDVVVKYHQKLVRRYLTATPAEIADEEVKSYHLVLHEMWNLNSERLLSTLLAFYSEDESNLERILAIALELEILGKLIDLDDVQFALDIAVLATDRKYLNLEDWLAAAVSVKGSDFLDGVFDFVEHKIQLEMSRQHQPASAPELPFTLSTEVYAIFLRVIRNAEGLTQENIERFKRVRGNAWFLRPYLLNFRPDNKDDQGLSVPTLNKEVHQAVELLYQRMYQGEITLDAVLEEFKRCRASPHEDEKEFYACALHYIFDEYRFLKTYPPRELAATGILFGAIMEAGLLTAAPAFVANRYVLDACKSSPNESLFQFGINALSVLRTSLVNYPGLCRSLLQIPALHESHAVLINDIVAALAEREELDLQGGVRLAFPALRLPILIEEGVNEFKEPEPQRRERIMFNINQITTQNFEQRMQELSELLEDQYSRWFAHYFIDVRVALEGNRHELYLQILDYLNSPVLEKHILWESYRKARDLLNSETITTNSSERAHLKQIGSWLGKITLARNIPVRLIHLNFKEFILHAHDNDRLATAMPFICQFLCGCRDSTVFHTPNPWLMAVLGLLAECFDHAKLRLNCKFEIEVLFRAINVPMADIPMSELIRNRPKPSSPKTDEPNRLDREWQRATSEIMHGSQRFGSPGNDAFAQMQQLQTERAVQEAQDAFQLRVAELVEHLPERLIFSPDNPFFTAPSLKRVFQEAINRAVTEIVTPVVERSVTIAGISSRDLVQKDFGMEGDALKMRRAAHVMVKNLAGNLALVTCKEALRTSMYSNVVSTLKQHGYTDENIPDAMINGVVNDNLDIACSIIKTSAMEKAVKDIDTNLTPAYAARRAHRESRTQQPFWDGASFGVSISHNALPDRLRLQQGGLLPAQLQVYEEFGEVPRPAAVLPFNGGPNGDGQHGYHGETMDRAALPHEIEHPEMVPSPRPPAPASDMSRLLEYASELMDSIDSSGLSSLNAVPPGHPIARSMNDIGALVEQSVERDFPLSASQKIVQLLYRSTTTVGREVFAVLLNRLCEMFPAVAVEVKEWLATADDSRKWNVPVTILMIRTQLLPLPLLDSSLSYNVMRQLPEIVDYAADLVRECVFGERPVTSRTSFAKTLTAILRVQELGHATPAVDSLLSELRAVTGAGRRGSVAASSANGDSGLVDTELEDRFKYYFLDWVKIFQTTHAIDSRFVPYITFLQKEGILNGDDVSLSFYRTATFCAIDCDSGKTADDNQFFGTDALAKLIVLIVKNYGDKSGSSSSQRSVYYFTKINTIICFALVQRNSEEGYDFDQRPWARLFTSILNYLTTFEIYLPEVYMGCLRTIANNMGIIQPTYAPKFAYGWISILFHRSFMPKLLSNREEGDTSFHRAFMWLLRFQEPFLRSGQMNESSRALFHATLRALVVIMKDFPDFLVEFYHTLSTAIPPNCVQLRNIIASAFPLSEGPLPDVYIHLDALVPVMQQFPIIRSDVSEVLNTGNLKNAIDQHVRSGQPQLNLLIKELKNRIGLQSILEDGETVITWNHTLLHAVVFYTGTSCIRRIAQQTGTVQFDAKAPEVGLLANLAFSLPPEGQYYMLCVVADHLRYPSAHTLFFISFMLLLFGTSSQSEQQNALPERISRVLLERVCVQRPHPWGLVVAFIELLENQRYGFWDQPFVHADPEILNMFLSVQSSIAQEHMLQESM